MKNFIICLFLFLFVTTVYSQDVAFIKNVANRVDIFVNEDEVQKYTDLEDIPELLFGSKIISNGFVIVTIYGSDFFLKKGQGILIAKEPITGEILVYQIKSSSSDDKIMVRINNHITTEMCQENILSFSRIGNTLKLKSVSGDLPITENGVVSNMFAGDYYYYKN